MYQRPGGRIEQPQQGKDNGRKIDAHGQGDAGLDGPDRCVGQAL